MRLENDRKQMDDVTEMSKELGIPERTCQRWLKEDHCGLFPSAKKVRPHRNAKWIVLRTEVEEAKSQVAMEEDF